MVELKFVNKFYNKQRILNNVSFFIEKGEILGLLGRNGSGKTTTFRAILNLVKPELGTIRWNNKPITPNDLDKIGYLPEQRSLFPKLTVYETVKFFARLKGVSNKQIKEKWTFWAKSLEISDYKHVAIKQLSKGNQQKIQILVSLIHNPSFIILDEPFSGLDPINRGTLIKILKIFLKNGASILFSTHNIYEIEDFCEKIAIINRGKILYFGKILDLKKRYDKNTIFVECLDNDKAIQDKLEQFKNNNDVSILNSNSINFFRAEFSTMNLMEKTIDWAKALPKLIKFEIEYPTLNSIFIDILKKEDQQKRYSYSGFVNNVQDEFNATKENPW